MIFALEGSATWIAGIISCFLALLCQMVKEGHFRRNSQDIQQCILRSSSDTCQTPVPISVVIPCDQGPHPLLALPIPFLGSRLKSRAIILCDSELVLVSRASGEARITGVVSRYKLGDLHVQRLGGLYVKVQLGEEQLWVERKYFDDVRAVADSVAGRTWPTG